MGRVEPYLECLAFRLDSEAGSVCYSGDSGPCAEIVELARGCDVLIHMNHHFSGAEPSESHRRASGNHADNADVARRAGVSMLVLTHLLPEFDAPDRRQQMLDAIGQAFDGQVVIGEDLMRIAIGGGGAAVGR